MTRNIRWVWIIGVVAALALTAPAGATEVDQLSAEEATKQPVKTDSCRQDDKEAKDAKKNECADEDSEKTVQVKVNTIEDIYAQRPRPVEPARLPIVVTWKPVTDE